MRGVDGTIEVLMVEDSPTDAELTIAALEDAKVRIHLHTAVDGVEAMEFMRKQGRFADAPKPDVVLLDLNMPRMDGREVLEEMRADPALETIPVVVLTTSEDEGDVEDAYRLKANCYVPKPVDFEQFMHVVRAIDRFWFTVVKLPA